MTTKSSRHKMVEVVCEWCGEFFMARKQRVDAGQSRFCSRKCYGEWQKENPQTERLGKENAKVYFSNGRYSVQWVDPKTMKAKSSTWAKWAWENAFGEVPVGYKIGFKDEDQTNIVLENLCLQSQNAINKKISNGNMGRKLSDEIKNKLSKAHTGKTLSKEHKKKIGDASRRLWASGKFDTVHVGKYNKNWRGGVEKQYPYEYSSIAPYVRERDNFLCQICGEGELTGRKGHVHHVDGDKRNNDLNNLILLCVSCHNKIHAKYATSPAIMAFRSKLYWNQ